MSSKDKNSGAHPPLWRPGRASLDLGGTNSSGRSTMSRTSRTPMKGSSSGRSTLGRQSRTPLRQSNRHSNRGTIGRPRMSSLSKGDGKTIQDPRDIKSKAFQSSAISCLIDFLARKGFKAPLSRKALSSPSTREFKAIFEFMVSCISPEYNIGATGLKFEQEVHKVFRELGYSFMLNKQHLSTVGAPHSWPYALAALDWLREVVELEDGLESEGCANLGDFELSDEGMVNEVRRLFQRHEFQTYTKYLVTGEAQLDPDFSREMDEVMLGGVDQAQLEAMRVEERHLREALAEREGRDDPLGAARAEMETVLVEDHRLMELLAEVESELELQARVVEERARSTEEAVQQRTAVEAETTRLKRVVETQPMRKEDEEQLLQRRQNLQAEVDHLDRVSMDLLEANGSEERQIARVMDSIEPKAIALAHRANHLGQLERHPDLQVGVSQFRESDSFMPRVEAALRTLHDEGRAEVDDAKSRLDMEARLSQQVTEELRQCSLLERTNREQVELLEEELGRVRSRVHAQEEAMLGERLAWERNLLRLREAVAVQEAELRAESERVRRAEEARRLREAELDAKLGARTEEAAALVAAVRSTMALSALHGDHLQAVMREVRPHLVDN